ncbi:hypothetical protein HNR56_003282, partial [Roseospira marina]|nr:hypothetical protein [Roseospira marina]MBB5088571.1 hypothetical protein [Roseospira marina]
PTVADDTIDWDAFFTLHHDMPREGPGSDAMTPTSSSKSATPSPEFRHEPKKWAAQNPRYPPFIAYKTLIRQKTADASGFEAHGARIDAVLSDNGREFCGRPDRHPYELFLQLEGIKHKRTQVSRPQSHDIVERLHRTLLDKHFRVEGRRTWFETVDEMQIALQTYLAH